MHRRQRKLLNPIFSLTQMKRLSPLVSSIANQFKDLLLRDMGGTSYHKVRSREIDIAEWLGRVGLEMVAQAGFGHTFHALEGDGDQYVRAVKDVMFVFTHLLFA